MWGGEWEVRWFEEIDSTNSYLRDQARAGAAEGLVAVADHQRPAGGASTGAGSRRRGPTCWPRSCCGPDCCPDDLHLCTGAVALAAADACREVAGVEPVLKWPNDLVVGGAKLAGVLAEAEFPAAASSRGGRDRAQRGLARARRMPGAPAWTTWRHGRRSTGRSCSNACSRRWRARRALLDDAAGRRELADEVRRRCATWASEVRVVLPAEELTGTAVAIDEAGRLVVETAAAPRP